MKTTVEVIQARDVLRLTLSVEEAKRIRAALSDLDGEDLDNYGRILETLRKALPQQWG